MRLPSDDVLVDDPCVNDPMFDAVYPRIGGFELWDPKAWRGGHPFSYYRAMQEQSPVLWCDFGRRGQGYWALSRYEDIRQVETQPDLFSSERGSINISIPPKSRWKVPVLMDAAINCLINLDAPSHLAVRSQHRAFFIPAYVERLQARVGSKVDQLLDDLEREGPEVDFVSRFAEQLPLFTLCEMLGIDEEDRPRIIRWMHYLELASQYLANPLSTFLAEPGFPFQFKAVLDDMFAFGEAIMADRRANPRQDLLTAIATTEVEGEALSQKMLDGSWLLIIFGGNDTTRNSLSGTIRLLTEFPDQRVKLSADPALLSNMCHETLRMISPVIQMRRTATEETEIAGQKIAKDEKVVMYYGAANHDPTIFGRPDVFDIERSNADKHLAFGHGPHKCLGQKIALMQLRIATEKILERFPNISMIGRPVIAPNAMVHATSKMKVSLYGARGGKGFSIPGFRSTLKTKARPESLASIASQ